MNRLSFQLPDDLRATQPPEARGVARDEVRMMVGSKSNGALQHRRFRDLPRFVNEDDLVVVNTSGTLPAAVNGRSPEDGQEVRVHFSVRLDDDEGGRERWVVEVRRPAGASSERWAKSAGFPGRDNAPPRYIVFGPGMVLDLLGPYRGSDRLWVGRPDLPEGATVVDLLHAKGRPIRYAYVEDEWPLSYYQNIYAGAPGSAEMPSAGRPFTERALVDLVRQGTTVAPIVLHTGVSSLGADELPYPEKAFVSAATAAKVNFTRARGGRVIAVGTTVVRALESAVRPGDGTVGPFDGWTDRVVSPATGVNVVDGLITGWHEPEASHLLLLEAIAGAELLARAYESSLERGYLWHEMGDVALFLP